jgi:UDP-glucose 4-epimerase
MTDAEPILLTGAAGFIGFHVTRRLLERGRSVVGLDNLDPYYDVRLKEARLKQLAGFSAFGFERLDIADRAGMAAFFSARRFPTVVHLAAQAGVRHSLADPHAYVDANIAASSTCSKVADGRIAGISSMHRPPRSTARTPKLRSAPRGPRTIRSVFMARPRGRTS